VVSAGYFLGEMARWTVADDGRIFVHDLPNGGGRGEDNERGVDLSLKNRHRRIDVPSLSTCKRRHSVL
jgi:hypothetical protein